MSRTSGTSGKGRIPGREPSGKARKGRKSRRLGLERLEERVLLSAAVDQSRYAADTLLVRFGDQTAPDEQAQLLSQYNGTVERQLGLVGATVVRVPEGTDIEAMASSLTADPRVEWAEPDYYWTLNAVPNDPRFNELWGLNNTGQLGGTPDADIDAPEAWDVFTGDSSVVVAVIDTGIDYNHEDLAANMWRNPGEIPGDGIDNEGNGYIDDVYGIDPWGDDSDPMDDNDHGTHVAGTIGAVGDNGIGVVGVNW
ncbi:MAG TPA: hypothetical protein EYP14_17665, partial [Planctomycetaceae bacterium]|nr:hypothetical protein [Planctomycetaceae bacterium]